jgi:predicted Zn-dependent protease
VQGKKGFIMRVFTRRGSLWVFVILGCALFLNPAYALTPAEEDELAEEFLRQAKAYYTFIEDPEIVDLVNTIGNRIADSLPEKLFDYHFYVVQDETFNAFATPSGHIFIHSGLIEQIESEDELAGILAHEIAHVSCRHISAKVEQSTRTRMASMAAVAASILLGLTGAGDAANAVLMGSMATQESAALAYSREVERQADQIAMEHLSRCGYPPECMLAGLKRMQKLDWRGATLPAYLFTHPITRDRVVSVSTWLDANSSVGTTESEVWSVDFDSVQTRFIALYGDPNSALQRFEEALRKDPEDPKAIYGYGLVLARMGHGEEAVRYIEKAWTQNTSNPSIQKDLGRVYCLNGQYKEALAVLEPGLKVGPYSLEGHYYFGLAQLRSGRLEDAERTFEKIIKRRSVLSQAERKRSPDHKGPPKGEGDGPDQGSPPEKPKPDEEGPDPMPREMMPQRESLYSKTLYSLGETYYQHGNLGESHYYLGLYYKEKRDFINAVFQMEQALALLDDSKKRREIEEALPQMRKAASMQRQMEERMRTAGAGRGRR